MSATSQIRRSSIADIRNRKGDRAAIACLTAYTTPMARSVDRHVDLVLVGDSLGMVIYGLETTVPVTLDMMIAHGAAVVRGSERACVVVDLPFGSYQESPERAFRAGARVMAETGCQAVKLEGGIEMAETVRFMVERGIPIMGHIGLTPQHVNRLGGFRVQGRTADGAEKLKNDARAIADAGAFAVVVEAVPSDVAALVTAAIEVPTIGIGAGLSCDGQILVTEDILGLFADFKPRFVKRFADLGGQVDAAVADYVDQVRTRRFPDADHTFAPTGDKP